MGVWRGLEGAREGVCGSRHHRGAGGTGWGPGKGEVVLGVSRSRGGGIPRMGARASKRVVSCGLEHAPYGGEDGLVGTGGPAGRGESWEGRIRDGSVT